MAITIIDGLNHYNAFNTSSLYNFWTSTGHDSRSAFVTGRFSGTTPRFNYCGVRRAIPNTETVTAGVAIQFTLQYGTTNANFVGVLDSGMAQQCGIKVHNDGSIGIYRGGATLLATSLPGLVREGGWHYVEVEMVVHDSSGRVTAFLDGQQVVEFLGDTKQTANSGASFVHFGGQNFGICAFDDIYVTDGSSRLGEMRVDILYPDSDDGANNWTPSSGSSGYAMIDEVVANGDTDYVQGPSVGFIDFYGLQDLAGTPANILAVAPMSSSRKTDAGAREICHKIRSNGNVEDAANIVLTSTYAYYQDIFELDPDGNVPWTYSAVNALEIGLEVKV